MISLLVIHVFQTLDHIRCETQMGQFTTNRVGNDLIIYGYVNLNSNDVNDSNLQPVNQVIINGTTHITNVLFSEKTWISQFNLNNNITFGARCFAFPLAITTITSGTFYGCSNSH